MRRRADSNYQSRAAEFAVGDFVAPYGVAKEFGGRVVALWPAIGMVDVQFPDGSKRYPVEELNRFTVAGELVPPEHDTVPGGAGTVPVSGGPVESQRKVARRVASMYKRSLYWAEVGRRYRPTKAECDANTFFCPRCGADQILQRTAYKREDGRNVKLLACHACLFLIRENDILRPDVG
jgi:predicted RNA-binding Zn-ribbon protein involved in translation (DUF1610 family)